MAETIQEITKLRLQDKTRKQIADEMQLSQSQIKTIIKENNIVRPPRYNKAKIVKAVPNYMTDEEEIPLMEQVKTILGDRMTETRMGYKLDGHYCNCNVLVEEAGLKFYDER